MTEDVFECRVEFSRLIAPLATSKKTLSQASAYALNHYTIHSDILDVLLTEMKESGVTSLAVKNFYALLESIVISSITNGWAGYKNAMEAKISTILSIIFHPKRHLDYHVDYVIKLLSLFATRGILSKPASREIIQTIDNFLARFTLLFNESSCTKSKDYDKLTNDKSELLERIEEERELQKRQRDSAYRANVLLDEPVHLAEQVMDNIKNEGGRYLSEKDIEILKKDLSMWMSSSH